MDHQKSFADRMEAFFAGKGFYIVLSLCIAVIGVSAWSILSGAGSGRDDPGISMAVSGLDEPMAASVPAAEAVMAPEASEVAAAPAEEPPAVSTAAPILAAPSAEQPASAAPAAPAPQTSAAQEREYFVWPVTGEIENPFSTSVLTFNRTMQDWRVHDGLDIAAELGTQVRAAANGQVAEIYHDDLYGTTVVISHRDGLCSIYSNLAETPTVSVGQQVSVGQIIGAVGDTALAETGEACHLHFAMQIDGQSVDPAEYMP